MRVDPKLPENHEKILWLVYGVDSFPAIICCKLSTKTGSLAIWGYSRYRRSPGFRTLGRELQPWIDEQKAKFHFDIFEFYDDHDEALQKLRLLTTPKGAK